MDESPIELVPALYAPRLHHVGPAHVDEDDRCFVVDGLHGRKFAKGAVRNSESTLAVEAFPKGTVLSADVRVSNATADEIGGLARAVGFAPRSPLKIGSAKGHGLGRLVPHAITVDLHDRRRARVDDALDVYRLAFEANQAYYPQGASALHELHVDAKL